MTATHAIRLLGITSVGLGILDYLSADRQAGKVGMESGSLFRLAGLREVVTGVGAVVFPTHAAPVAARLIGDVTDIAILSAVAARPANDRRIAALAGAGMVVAITVIDVFALLSIRRR